MRVLMVSRENLFENIGGDTIQIINTKLKLEDLGVYVEIYDKIKNQAPDEFDIIHFFNITRPIEILPFLRYKEVKKVCSPVYVDYSDFEKRNPNLIRRNLRNFLGKHGFEWLKLILRAIKENKLSNNHLQLIPYKSKIRKILNSMDYILPNSHNEFRRIEKDFGSISAPYEKIVNGISANEITPDLKFKDAIICSGRIEGIKNQYNLIKALNELSYPVFIIGNPSTHQQKYFEECKRIAKPHIQFIERLTQDELFSVFAAAKVHVLPSFFETTGLVSLEAAYYGCNIVVTDKGDQKEYFEQIAEFCDPNDINSIREAVEKAYHKKYDEKVKLLIDENYKWENTAEKTFNIYKKVLKH